MKKIFLPLFVLLITFNSQARSQVKEFPITSFNNTATIISDGNYYPSIASIEVSNYGNINVEIEVQSHTMPVKRIQRKLSSENFRLINAYVSTLQNVEIETHYNQVICMMMPPFGADKLTGLLVRQNKIGEMQEMLNPSGCWNPRKVRPENEDRFRDAVALKTILQVIINEEVALEFPN